MVAHYAICKLELSAVRRIWRKYEKNLSTYIYIIYIVITVYISHVMYISGCSGMYMAYNDINMLVILHPTVVYDIVVFPHIRHSSLHYNIFR